MQLNQLMKDCFIAVMEEEPDLDFQETVFAGIGRYVETVGHTIEVEDDEEGEEFVRNCFSFVLDCTLTNLILHGAIEVSGIEDGDFTYSLAPGFDKDAFLAGSPEDE